MCAGWGGSRPQPPVPDLCQGPRQALHNLLLQERLCVPGSASPLHEQGLGCPRPQHLWAESALPTDREGTTEHPKDKGTGMTHPGLAAAVAAAELCQLEELLAEQPGDPTEEIGPFKRDSDK